MAGLDQQPSEACLTNWNYMEWNKNGKQIFVFFLFCFVYNPIFLPYIYLFQTFSGFITQRVFCHGCRDERGQKHWQQGPQSIPIHLVLYY